MTVPTPADTACEPAPPARLFTEPPGRDDLFAALLNPALGWRDRRLAAKVVIYHFSDAVYRWAEFRRADPAVIDHAVKRKLLRCLRRQASLVLAPSSRWDPARGFAPRVIRITRNALSDYWRKRGLKPTDPKPLAPVGGDDAAQVFAQVASPFDLGSDPSGITVRVTDAHRPVFGRPEVRCPVDRVEAALAMMMVLRRRGAAGLAVLNATVVEGQSAGQAGAGAGKAAGAVAAVKHRFGKDTRAELARLRALVGAIRETRFGGLFAPRPGEDGAVPLAVHTALGRETGAGFALLAGVSKRLAPAAAATPDLLPDPVVVGWAVVAICDGSTSPRVRRRLHDILGDATRPGANHLSADELSASLAKIFSDAIRPGDKPVSPDEPSAALGKIFSKLICLKAVRRHLPALRELMAEDKVDRFDARFLAKLRAVTAEQLVDRAKSGRGGGRVGPVRAGLDGLGPADLAAVRAVVLGPGPADKAGIAAQTKLKVPDLDRLEIRFRKLAAG